jgi:hypothetical protein
MDVPMHGEEVGPNPLIVDDVFKELSGLDVAYWVQSAVLVKRAYCIGARTARVS